MPEQSLRELLAVIAQLIEATGRLVPVLEDWCQPFSGFFLYYPGRRQMPRALRAAGLNHLRLTTRACSSRAAPARSGKRPGCGIKLPGR